MPRLARIVLEFGTVTSDVVVNRARGGKRLQAPTRSSNSSRVTTFRLPGF
jgi:hypothetical protein